MKEELYNLGIKGLIRSTEGKVLLLQINPAHMPGNKHGNYWDLPGGRVQHNENVKDTLVREIEEEIGVSKISNVKSVGMVVSNIRIPLHHAHGTKGVENDETIGLILGVYSCSIPEDSTITISEEHLGYDWFAPTEAAKLLAVKYPADLCDIIAKL